MAGGVAFWLAQAVCLSFGAGPAGTLRWKFATGDMVEASGPAVSVDQQTLYVGSWDTNLYAIHTGNGTLRWKFATGSIVDTSPAVSVDGGTVYTGSKDTHIYAIHTRNGTLRWAYDVGGGGSYTGPTPVVSAAQQTVYACGGASLYAMHTANGTLRWKHNADPPNSGCGLPVLSADQQTVYFGSVPVATPGPACGAPRLYAIDAADGGPRWNSTVNGSCYLGAPTVSADQQTVFVGAGNEDSNPETNQLYAIHTANGTTRWKYAFLPSSGGSVFPVSQPTVSADQQTVFVGAGNQLYAIHTANGTTRWKSAILGYSVGLGSVLSADQQTLYIGSQSGEAGKLHAINAANGTDCWYYATPAEVVDRPALSPGTGRQTAYFGCDNGNIYAVQV
eukprot:gene24047-1672_t